MDTTLADHLKDVRKLKQKERNAAYRNAIELFKVARTEDDIWQALFVCNRGNRPELLQEAITQIPLSDIAINEMIDYVWIDSENVYNWQGIWDEIWCNYSNPYQKKLINRIFKQPIKLYRAGNLDGEYQSWTFSEKVAKFFAMRRIQDKVIHEQYFSAEDVVAIFNSRGEKEVVIKG